MKITGYESNSDIVKEIGLRIKSKRIDMNLTQEELSLKAGVSLRTLVNIELGKPTNIIMLINVLRALKLLANIDILVPEVTVRPYDYFKLNKKRERVRQIKQKDIDYKWKK